MNYRVQALRKPKTKKTKAKKQNPKPARKRTGGNEASKNRCGGSVASRTRLQLFARRRFTRQSTPPGGRPKQHVSLPLGTVTEPATPGQKRKRCQSGGVEQASKRPRRNSTITLSPSPTRSQSRRNLQ